MKRLSKSLANAVAGDDLLVRVVVSFFGIGFCGLGFTLLAWLATGGLQGESAWLVALAGVLALAPATYGLILVFRALGSPRLINQARGFTKSLGQRCSASSSEAFPRRVRAALPKDLFPGLETLLAMIEHLTAEIRAMDRELERLCRERYPETEVLRQVKGVGPITALASC